MSAPYDVGTRVLLHGGVPARIVRVLPILCPHTPSRRIIAYGYEVACGETTRIAVAAEFQERR